ncbi:hypothetical protein [Streptomyces sp. NPDC045470]|uniref:hypothetical protein n=1 Tax=unclassified Streptomyces TaxID=2593676 RepID=UPI0033F36B32
MSADSLREASRRSEDGDAQRNTAWDAMVAQFGDICAACDEIYIFGSRPVAEAAIDLRRACETLVKTALKAGRLRLNEEELTQARDDRERARETQAAKFGAFLRACHFELVGETIDPSR